MAYPTYIDATGALTDGEAWVTVGSTTLSSDASSVTFTSTNDGQTGDFSQYLDLVLICYAQTASTGAAYSYLDTYFNNDTTGGNYKRQWLGGDGSSVTAQATTTIRVPIGSGNLGANTFGVAVVQFFDINSGKQKSVMFEAAHDGEGSGWVKTGVATWKSQAAITEIDFVGWQGNYDIKSGSRFDLFGVLPRMVS